MNLGGSKQDHLTNRVKEGKQHIPCLRWSTNSTSVHLCAAACKVSGAHEGSSGMKTNLRVPIHSVTNWTQALQSNSTSQELPSHSQTS